MGCLAVAKYLTANLASKRGRVRELVRALREEQPDVAVLTEAYHARWWLLLVRGYKLRQYSRLRGPEAPGIAFLVKRGRKIEQRWLMRMTEPWHGPHGRRHQPRRYPVMVVEDLPPILGLHAPWPHGTDAWYETWRRVTRWLLAHPEAHAPGDWNAQAHELTRHMPQGLQLVVGTKVDHDLTRGMRHAWTKRLRELQPEGMHGWIVYGYQGDGT